MSGHSLEKSEQKWSKSGFINNLIQGQMSHITGVIGGYYLQLAL